MISLEQVRALETRVEKAVELIASLKNENNQLRLRLTASEGRVAELEEKVQLFQQDQVRIEEGIVQALRKLDFFEDAVYAAGAQMAAQPAPASAGPSTGFAGRETASAVPESGRDAQEPVQEPSEAGFFEDDTSAEPSADSSQLF